MTFEWQKEAGLAIGLGLLTLFAYGFLLEGGAVPYSAHSDLVAVHLSVKHAAYESIQSGHGLPFWRSDMLSGGLALTHPQALYTHPLQLPFLFMHPSEASGPSIWLHFLAMALCLGILGRAMGLGYFARGFMAVAGLFSFKLIIMTYAGWLPVLPGFVTAPLLMAGVLEALDRPRAGAAFLLALGGTLALHSGHLQISYYTTMFCSVYVLLCCLGWLRQRRAAFALRVVSVCLVAGIVAACSSAYLLLPLAAEMKLTARTAASYEFLHSGGAYAAENLATFLHPEILGTPLDDSYAQVELWENVAYFGAIAQLLAVLGGVLGVRRRHARFFLVAFVASIALAFDSVLLRGIYDLVPGFSLFRIPSRFLFLTSLFGIALAGIGFEELLGRVRARVAPGRAGRAALAVGSALILLSIWEGASYARRYIRMAASDEIVPQTDYAAYLAEDHSAFRVAPFERSTVNYGWGAFMHLELVTGFEPYNYRHYLQYMALMATGRVLEPVPSVWVDLGRIARWDLFDALNIKYVLTRRALAVVPRGLERVARFDEQPLFEFYRGFSTSPIYLYENRGAASRVRWAPGLVVVEGSKDALKAALEVDLGSQTIVESASGGPPFVGPSEDDTLSLVARRGGYLALDASSQHGGFAVISEIWHPGWSATLDGQPLAIERTNLAMMGAWVPAGEHRLAFRFRPLLFGPALIATAAGLAGLLCLATLCFRARRWAHPPAATGCEKR